MEEGRQGEERQSDDILKMISLFRRENKHCEHFYWKSFHDLTHESIVVYLLREKVLIIWTNSNNLTWNFRNDKVLKKYV